MGIALDRPLDRMEGTIRHRLLVSYAADPDVVRPLVPAPLRVQEVAGRAVVGICCIGLDDLRPAGLPAWLGLRSDNAAHRIAVEWDAPDGPVEGVYVLRRDTAERVPRLLGGRVFPGVHGRARVDVRQRGDRLSIALRTRDGVEVAVEAAPATGWTSRLFETAEVASRFYARCGAGFSPGRHGELEGVHMASSRWATEPVDVQVASSFYDDRTRFPEGSIELDSALLMRDLPVLWTRIPTPGDAGVLAA